MLREYMHCRYLECDLFYGPFSSLEYKTSKANMTDIRTIVQNMDEKRLWSSGGNKNPILN